jgi:hypothetical protein
MSVKKDKDEKGLPQIESDAKSYILENSIGGQVVG